MHLEGQVSHSNPQRMLSGTFLIGSCHNSETNIEEGILHINKVLEENKFPASSDYVEPEPEVLEIDFDSSIPLFRFLCKYFCRFL